MINEVNVWLPNELCNESNIKDKTNFKIMNCARIGDEIIGKINAHWVVLSKDSLEGTSHELFKTQKKLVKA